MLLAEMVYGCNHANKQDFTDLRIDKVFQSYSDLWGTSLLEKSIDYAIQKAKEVVHPGSRLDHKGSWG